MIDLENEFVKELIEKAKKKIESEILRCFECIVQPLYAGGIKDGKYTVLIAYKALENAFGLPKDFYMATNIEIIKKDYEKWIKKEEKYKEDKNEKSTYTPGHQWCR